MTILSRRLIAAVLSSLQFGVPVVQAEVLAGYTYEFEGLHSQNVCGAHTGVTIRTRFYTYVGANGRDMFFYMIDSGGLHFDLEKVRSSGQSVSVKAGSNRYDATARMTGDQMNINILGTNPQGGQAKYQLRFAMTGSSCDAIDFKLKMGGCGDDGQDARADRCSVHPGRRNSR